MKTLPKYFAIAFKKSPIWEKYVNWINEKYDEEYPADSSNWNEREIFGVDDEGVDFHYEMGNFNDQTKLITLEEWDSIVNGTQNKNLTYETQYLRSDGTLFTKDSIDGVTIEALTADMKKHISESNRLRGLLKAHKNKFS